MKDGFISSSMTLTELACTQEHVQTFKCLVCVGTVPTQSADSTETAQCRSSHSQGPKTEDWTIVRCPIHPEVNDTEENNRKNAIQVQQVLAGR